MRRTVVATIVIAMTAASVAIAAPSHATTPTTTVPDGMYLWSYRYTNIDAHPPTAFVHLGTVGVSGSSSIITATASEGSSSYQIQIGQNGGPALTAGASQLPVSVFTAGSNCFGTAWVAIDDIAFDGNGAPTQLAAHFTAPCPGSSPTTVSASVMVNTTVAEPAHDITPVAMLFGTAYKAPDLGVPVTIRNPSTVPLPIQSVTPSTSAFAVSDDHCSGVTVAPGGSCTLRVGPHPNGPVGEHTAELQISDGMATVAGHGASWIPLEANYVSVPRSEFVTEPAAPSMPTDTATLVGDFDGSYSDDIFFYGAGSTHDSMWLSDTDRTWDEVSPPQVQGNYEPLVGDFDGSGRDAIFWYAPGSAPDSIWYDVVDHTGFRTLQVSGKYRPIVGDFNGDGIDDILWYAPGPAPDSIWFGQRNRTFTTRSVTINGDYQYVSGGDLNGDGATDLLFWNPDTTQHPLWLSGSNGVFTASHIVGPAAASIPLLMYVDDDSAADVLWYGPGSTPDALDLSSQNYARPPLHIEGNYEVMWANFDGDNEFRSDILWWVAASSANTDPMWISNGNGFTTVNTGLPHVDFNRYFTLLGNFQAGPLYRSGEPDSTDIVYAPDFLGDQTIVWWSHDIDGTSNPTVWSRLRAPFVAPQRPALLSGPGRCNAAAPVAVRLACRS
jgi:hypothetical protein